RANLKKIKYESSNQVFPSSVKCIKFGITFNHPIYRNTLPDSLTELYFGEAFEQPLEKGLLPSSITKLTFERGFYHQDLLDWIPHSVTKLQIGHIHTDQRKNERPWNIVFPIEKLLNTLVSSLILGDRETIESTDLIPSNIKEIRLCKCNIIKHIPTTIEALYLGNSHNEPLNKYF
ncbi:hypothetical protein CYY_003469, partial [Polysphondylium violaceum]